MSPRANPLRRVAAAGLVVGSVLLGLAAQAGAHLLGLTSPAAVSEDGVRWSFKFAEPGPHPVGMRMLRPESGSSEMTMWYPAASGEEAGPGVDYSYGVRLFGANTETALATFAGRATLGAPFDGTSRPVTVLSHGFALTPGTYGWLAEHLASHGMVVVAPDHAETLDPGRLWSATIERSEAIRAVFADLERRSAPDGDLHGVIDMSTVAVLGHSYGGYTALVAGGAELDLGSFAQICSEARSTGDPITFLCEALGPHRDEIEARTATPADLGVDALVSISGDAVMFGSSGLAAITAPVMVIGGTADTDTPYAWGPGLTFEHAGSERKVEVALEGAGHLVFAGRCEATRRLLSLADLGFCSDPAWERDAAQAVVKHHVAAFLRAELFGDTEATVALGRPHQSIGAVVYRSEGY